MTCRLCGKSFFIVKRVLTKKKSLNFWGCFWRKSVTWGQDSGKGKVYSALPLPASQPHVFGCA